MFYLWQLFRSFLPLHNPIGFGGPDFIELFLAVAVVALACSRRLLTRVLGAVAPKTWWCMLALFLLPIALRLAMLPVHPVPTPLAIDDSSYVLLGDTLAHFRFSNPPHALPQFFETLFVLQQPRYASFFQMGQGIVLAFGEIIFRNPWAGVALSIGALSAACYWMLRAWTSPAWSLAGGIFAALQFGALSQWMNSFWGGAVAGVAGCLAFGALPRLEETGQRKYALLLGAGIGISALSRPYETVFLVLAVLLFFAREFARRLRVLLRGAPLILATALPAIGLTLLQNHSVSGSWTTLPYVLSRYEYGVPTTFTWQPDPVPHRELNPQQALGYQVQKATHDDQAALGFFARLAQRAFVYRFYYLAPLLLAVPFFVPRMREFHFTWVALTLGMFACGTNLYPYFYSHYIAAIACLFVLVFVAALDSMPTAGARIVIYLAVAHFAFWYTLHFAGKQDFARNMWQFETSDAINTGDPQGRATIHAQLDAAPGRHLVFVRYRPGHAFEEWVYNAADIDSSRTVWAHDLGAEENEKLRRYYPDRDAWLLEPDARPPLLAPYDRAPQSVMETIAPAPAAPAAPPATKRKTPLRFEDIPK